MWAAWVDIARARLAAGDRDGAAFAARLANDGAGDACPFVEPELACAFASQDELRAKVAAEAGHKVSVHWRPRPGRTHADHADIDRGGTDDDFKL